MLSQYNPVDIEHALRSASPPPPFPPASDRTAWDEVREALGSEAVDAALAQAEDAASTPIPALPATLYLDLQRTGQREGYMIPLNQRRTMLWYVVLGECLEHRGRFLDPILDIAWAICEESSWVMPAHQPVLEDMRRPIIDLGSATTGLMLAEMDLLLGKELDPALGERIRYEVDRRSLTPYLARHDHWWLYNSHRRTVNNWTAVCNAGVAGAALYLEPDPARLGEILARAARSMDDYVATFDADGGSTEGPGYWSYGFGNYTLLAHLVEQRTEGQVDFWEGEQMRQIAQFPLRTVLSPGWYVNFSDCDREVSLNAPQLTYLARRLGLPALEQLAAEQPTHRYAQSLIWGLRSLFWRPSPDQVGHPPLARRDWFRGMMWMIARMDPQDPDALVLAAKGGHNGEMHNQNDVGNVIVHVDGESVIPDIGRGRYTKAYFSPQRYEHLANSSLGHSVPVPNGQAQVQGKDHGAVLLEHTGDGVVDRLCLELKGAYPAEADLETLKRTIALHREGPRGWVELVDEVRFLSGPGTLESVLTTFAEVTIGTSSVVLRGERGTLRVHFADGVTARLEVVESVDMSTGPEDVGRLIFALTDPAPEGVIRLRIEPA